ANGLTAVSQTYLDWALANAGRSAMSSDRAFPIGFEPPAVSPAQINSGMKELRRHGIDPSRPSCFFAGLFERSYDLATVIDAAQILTCTGMGKLQFVLCGDGSRAASWRRRAAALPNVFFPGWVDSITLTAGMSFSSVGLCAYASDATQSLPNKPFEYLASGLAIVSSLGEELANLLEQNQCGVTYQAGNAHSLASQISPLFDNPSRLAELQTSGRALWEKQFRCETIYANFVTYLETITSSHRAAA
ncbi:MAG: glycosyltransferase, partial [Aeoliella sp.]